MLGPFFIAQSRHCSMSLEVHKSMFEFGWALWVASWAHQRLIWRCFKGSCALSCVVLSNPEFDSYLVPFCSNGSRHPGLKPRALVCLCNWHGLSNIDLQKETLQRFWEKPLWERKKEEMFHLVELNTFHISGTSLTIKFQKLHLWLQPWNYQIASQILT